MSKRELELILTSYNKIEERKFISEISDFAEKGRKYILPAFSEIVESESVSLHLKYLVIKTMGVLKYQEFIPILAVMKRPGEKIRIVLEAVRSLVQYGSVEAYKIIVDFIDASHNDEHREPLESQVKEMVSDTPLIYYYDILYRQKIRIQDDLYKGIDLLAENLEESDIAELSRIFETESTTLSHGLLMVMEQNPSRVYYANIYRYFTKRLKVSAEREFRLILNTLVSCALLFGSRDKIFNNLKKHIPELRGLKRNIYIMTLLRFGKDETVDYITEVYQELPAKHKAAVFDNLQHNFRGRDFARQQMLLEPEELVVDSIISFLAAAGDTVFLSSIARDKPEDMKVKVLDMVLSVENQDVSEDVADFIVPGSNSESVRMVLKYILNRKADKYYDLVKDVWNSDPSADIRSTIVRNCATFNPFNREKVLEMVFDSVSEHRGPDKDLLITVSGIINSGEHDITVVRDYVNRILVMMEQAEAEEIVNYIYFFDTTEIEDADLWDLIKDELRMVQNTLLVEKKEEQMVKMIHYLIKKIDKKLLLGR